MTRKAYLLGLNHWVVSSATEDTDVDTTDNHGSPVRVEPGMQVQPSLVGFGNSGGERVPVGVRFLALMTRQVHAPRIMQAGVERVGHRPDLQQRWSV